MIKTRKLKERKHSSLRRNCFSAFSFFLLTFFCSYGQTTISSVSALASAAANSNQTIVMTPGVYQMSDYLTSTVINNNVRDANNRSAMITFSGNNNTFDFTGVTIEVDTNLLNDYGNRVIEFYVTGDDVSVKGLTVTDIGTSPTNNGGQSMTVSGDNITIEDVTLNISGSTPYGYGDLLGKGDGNLVVLRKHSGMLIEGKDIDIIGCSIISRAYGHLFFIQGGRNILFQDCYAESETRTTNDMLAETSGTAFNLDFASVYTNLNGDKVITPGYTKSLSEVGYRSYGAGGIDGNTTGAITLINCKAKDTRSGFAFVRYGGDVLIKNCEAIGCEAGFQVEEVTIENSRGDAVNGPLLYLNGGASDVELDLIPTLNTTTLHAIATIGGNDHNVTLNAYGSIITQQNSILIGSTRPSGANPFSPMGTTATSNLTLNNCTGMPVIIGSTASSNTITSNGTVTNNGSNNTINNSNCALAFVPDPTKSYYIDCPRWDLRVAASGSGQDPYTTSTSTTNDDVKWKFVDKGNGYWHIDRAAGGSVARLRSDGTEDADMQGTGNVGINTYYHITETGTSGTYYITLPDGTVNHQRLQVNNLGNVKMTGTNSTGSWETFTITEVEFVPDVNKTYYIDSPVHNLRLASTGASQDAYTTSTSTTNDDVKWKFVDKGNGYWHIDRAAGGSVPRLRTDNSANADMQATSSVGTYTYFDYSEGSTNGTYFLTLPNGPANFKRLQVNSSGDVKMVSTGSAGTWESFSITETSSSSSNKTGVATIEPLESIDTEIINLYPNPVSNYLTVLLPSSEYNQYVIYDVSGTIITQNTITNDIQKLSIDVTNFSDGMHIISFIGSQSTKTLKFVKK